MRIYHFRKNRKKGQHLYTIFGEAPEENYQVYQLKGSKCQYHIKNMKGRILARIIPGRFREERIMVYFDRQTMEAGRDKDHYFMKHYPFNRNISIEGEAFHSIQWVIEDEKILCQRNVSMFKEKEEWIFYKEDIEEMIIVLFCISYMEMKKS